MINLECPCLESNVLIPPFFCRSLSPPSRYFLFLLCARAPLQVRRTREEMTTLEQPRDEEEEKKETRESIKTNITRSRHYSLASDTLIRTSRI